MNSKAALIGAWALSVLAVSSVGVAAETARDKALNAGATALTSQQIADRIVGKTVTAMKGKKRFLFHYSANNVISGKLIGGGWSDKGYYGITDDNRVCLSMSKSDKGRLRCMSLLVQDGAVRKYSVDGRMTFELLKFQDGNRL